MSISPRSRLARASVAVAVALAVGVAGACGGGDDDGDNGDGGDTASLTARADTLVSCLNGAGLTASVKDTLPFGVDAPVKGVEAGGLSDTRYKVTVWLFESEADAQESRPLITLSREDTMRSRLLGRAVEDFSHVPSADDRATVSGCLVTPTI